MTNPIHRKRANQYREKALELKGPYCHICSATLNVEVHHIAGDTILAGRHHIQGLLPLCEQCHRKITDRSDEWPFNQWAELADDAMFPHTTPNGAHEDRPPVPKKIQRTVSGDHLAVFPEDVDTSWERALVLHGVKMGLQLADADAGFEELHEKLDG